MRFFFQQHRCYELMSKSETKTGLQGICVWKCSHSQLILLSRGGLFTRHSTRHMHNMNYRNETDMATQIFIGKKKRWGLSLQLSPIDGLISWFSLLKSVPVEMFAKNRWRQSTLSMHHSCFTIQFISASLFSTQFISDFVWAVHSVPVSDSGRKMACFNDSLTALKRCIKKPWSRFI